MTSPQQDDELRERLIDILDDQRFGDNTVNTKLLHKDIEWIIDQLLPNIRRYAQKMVVEELRQIVADTLEPEQVGGKFIREEVAEFAKQMKTFIHDRIAAIERKGKSE
jgi:hypothetical protein